MSNEKVLKLRGRKAYWGPSDSGPIDPSRLPEGYPYKEQSTVEILKDYAFEPTYNMFGYTHEKDVSSLLAPVDTTAKLCVVMDGEEYLLEGTVGGAETRYGNEWVYSKAIGAPNSALASIPNTGEPFAVRVAADEICFYFVEEGSHVVTLSQNNTTIHRIDPEYLPEGYPYKEGSKTVIEWDGNTEGLVAFNERYFKVSDDVPDDLSGCAVSVATLFDDVGKESREVLLVCMTEESGARAYGDDTSTMTALVATDGNEIGMDSGIYLLRYIDHYGNPVWVEKLTYGTETIHPMSEEFLPELTSPNGTKYKLTVSDDGTLSVVAVE